VIWNWATNQMFGWLSWPVVELRYFEWQGTPPILQYRRRLTPFFPWGTWQPVPTWVQMK
jgi:hypothetical protein